MGKETTRQLFCCIVRLAIIFTSGKNLCWSAVGIQVDRYLGLVHCAGVAVSGFPQAFEEIGICGWCMNIVVGVAGTDWVPWELMVSRQSRDKPFVMVEVLEHAGHRLGPPQGREHRSKHLGKEFWTQLHVT